MIKNWQKKEKKDAKTFKARPTLRSGGIWFDKGDQTNEIFLIDSKTSKHQRFSIPVKMWKKVKKEALTSGKTPILSLGFGKYDSIRDEYECELVVIDINDFEVLMEEKK